MGKQRKSKIKNSNMTNHKSNNRINKDLLKSLIQKLELTEDGINKKIHALRQRRGNDIFRSDAALLLASFNNIDITKFADGEKLKEIRNLKDKEYPVTTTKTKVKEKDRIIKLKDITITSREPYLTKKIISESKKMSEYYSMLYILENTLRNLIREVYKNQADYWKQKVPGEVKTRVAEIISKEKYYEEGRVDELEYSHLDFLKQIVVHNWKDFSDFIKEPEKSKFINEIEKFMSCRHAVAHTTFLKGLDAQRCQYKVEEMLRMF